VFCGGDGDGLWPWLCSGCAALNLAGLHPVACTQARPRPARPLCLRACRRPRRTQSLVERTQALEQLYAQQMQRLKGYMPEGAYTRVAEARLRAPDGSLMQRVDVLEEALELLLRAQDLAWQEEEERRRVRAGCCGGCTIC
jgi:hypothetical protein